jgi:hypothetical protein
MKLGLHPIIIKLYLLRNELYFLEKELDSFEKSEEPSGFYDNILITTDRFHRARDRATKIYGSEQVVDNFIYLLDRISGEA